MPDPVSSAPTPPTADRADLGGRTFGPYRLEAPVAVGEIGVVFQARGNTPEGQDRPLALHVPLLDLQRDEAFQGLYRMDATEARTLRHPNLIPVLDAGRVNGLVYRAHAWVEGWDLASVVRRALEMGRSLDVQQISSLGVQICGALVYLHERADLEGTPSPLVHGHVNLSRVLLSSSGQPKLLGLPSPRGRASSGYGRVTNLDPAEMAPEQLRPGGLSARADLYQLGLLMYAMWLGGTPFRRRARRQTIAAVVAGVGNIQRADRLPASLRTLLESALSVDPAKRPDSARAMANVLEGVLAAAGGPIPASRWHATLVELFPAGARPADGVRLIQGLDEVRRLHQALDGQSPLRSPQESSSTLVPALDPGQDSAEIETVPAMVEMASSADLPTPKIVPSVPQISLLTTPNTPVVQAPPDSAVDAAGWGLEEVTEITDLGKLMPAEAETEPSLPASVQVTSPPPAPAVPPSKPSASALAAAAAPVATPPGPIPTSPPRPVVARPAPIPTLARPVPDAARTRRGVWLAVLAVGFAVGLAVVLIYPRAERHPSPLPSAPVAETPPAPPPAPVAPPAPPPAPVAPPVAETPPAPVAETPPAETSVAVATPEVKAPPAPVVEKARPVAEKTQPVVAKAAPITQKPAPVVEKAPPVPMASVAQTGPKTAPAAPATTRSAPVVPPVTQAPVATPAVAPTAPETAAPALVHLVDLSVNGGNSSVTITGKLDGEGARPFGFILGSQYVVRYKGVGATVATRDLAVSSTLATGVHVSEKGGTTSILVDLAAGTDLTPKLTWNPNGFVLTLAPTAASP